MLRKYLGALVLFLMVSSFGLAQNKVNLWVEAGGDYFFSKEAGSAGWMIGGGLLIQEKHTLGIQYIQDLSLGDVIAKPDKDFYKDYRRTTITYGYILPTSTPYRLSVHTGITLGAYQIRGRIPNDPSVTPGINYPQFSISDRYGRYIGVPVMARIQFPGPFTGVALTTYLNIHKYTEFGFCLAVQLGFIRV